MTGQEACAAETERGRRGAKCRCALTVHGVLSQADALPKEDEIVTVDQFTLFGIGEGCVRGITRLDYSLAHGSRNYLEVAIPEGVRIMQVKGNMIKVSEWLGQVLPEK
jgi:hypothetical protein